MSGYLSSSQWLASLQEERPPLQLRKKGALPLQEDSALHQRFMQQDATLYALTVLADGVTQGQALRVLYHLLKTSRAGLPEEARRLVAEVTQILLRVLPESEVLTLFLVLRRERVNHNHTSRAILHFLLNHPMRRELWASRRGAVSEALEHALGGPVSRGCREAVLAEKHDEAQQKYLQRHLLRFTSAEPAQVKAWLKHLWKKNKEVRPALLSPAKRRELLARPAFLSTEEKARPRTITATNRGDISAALVHLYRGGTSPELVEALQQFVEKAAATAPRFSGKLALILDASASTRGYGEREFCCISQSVAFKMVLEKACPRLELWMVGGHSDPPIPQGETDLATALLDALDGDPDLAVIVSDGYENAEHGDVERVLASLPTIGVTTPVVFCHSKFTHKDALDLRRPVRNAIELSFWHEDDFAGLCLELFSMARGEAGTSFLRQNLQQRLRALLESK
jgi:hypothetical protein